jgi:histidine triad (HIT) family protein
MRKVDKAEALARVQESLRPLQTAHFAVPCAMCAIADGRLNVELTVFEDELALVTVDRFAALPGHLLVIFKRHVERITELTQAEYLSLQTAVFRSTLLIQKHRAPTRIFTAMFGSSENVGISVPHVHAHVVPVACEDESTRPGRVFSWSHGVYLYDDGEAEAYAAELRTLLGASSSSK